MYGPSQGDFIALALICALVGALAFWGLSHLFAHIHVSWS
jgi:2C-methyl-D-erythritol 2,4-cyclodiphosphate synthase